MYYSYLTVTTPTERIRVTTIFGRICIDIMELKRMMEKLGQAKTHLELKKMIAEVDKTNSGKRGKENN